MAASKKPNLAKAAAAGAASTRASTLPPDTSLSGLLKWFETKYHWKAPTFIGRLTSLFDDGIADAKFSPKNPDGRFFRATFTVTPKTGWQWSVGKVGVCKVDAFGIAIEHHNPASSRGSPS